MPTKPWRITHQRGMGNGLMGLGFILTDESGA